MTTTKKYPNNNEAKNGVTINSIKYVVMHYGAKARPARSCSYSTFELIDGMAANAEQLVKAIAEGDYGFATEIANTVMKYGRISEKQAYWVARTAWENEVRAVFENLESRHNYFAAADEYDY